MKGTIYIDAEVIGTADFKVMDVSMGAIGGVLRVNENYVRYRERVQKLCSKYGIANIESLNLAMQLGDVFQGVPNGGIGITDLAECEEIEVESAGLNGAVIDGLLNEQSVE